MDAGRVLRDARRRAGLTQRELADAASVPQSQIAKIESGAVTPRVDTLDRLLDACGHGLESLPRPGIGVDRTLIAASLRLRPATRLRRSAERASSIERLRRGMPSR